MDKLEEFYKDILQKMGDDEFIALVAQVQSNQCRLALELQNPNAMGLPSWLQAECQRRIKARGNK